MDRLPSSHDFFRLGSRLGSVLLELFVIGLLERLPWKDYFPWRAINLDDNTNEVTKIYHSMKYLIPIHFSHCQRITVGQFRNTAFN
jgi:hypothetical protein